MPGYFWSLAAGLVGLGLLEEGCNWEQALEDQKPSAIPMCSLCFQLGLWDTSSQQFLPPTATMPRCVGLFPSETISPKKFSLFKLLLILISHVTVCDWGKSRQELKLGTWKKKLKQGTRRNDSRWLAPPCLLSLHSYSTGLLVRGRTVHAELDPPTSVLNQENTFTEVQKANLIKVVSQ